MIEETDYGVSFYYDLKDSDCCLLVHSLQLSTLLS